MRDSLRIRNRRVTLLRIHTHLEPAFRKQLHRNQLRQEGKQQANKRSQLRPTLGLSFLLGGKAAAKSRNQLRRIPLRREANCALSRNRKQGIQQLLAGILIVLERLRRREEEYVRSDSQAIAEAQERYLAQGFAKLQSVGYFSDLPPLNRQTSKNLLAELRKEHVAALILCEFLARRWKPRGWLDLGYAVQEVRSGIMPWLFGSGFINGPVWKGSPIPAPKPQDYAPVADGPPQPAVEPEDAPYPSPWMRIKREIKRQTSPQDYQNWFVRTQFMEMQGDDLVVWVPDQITMDWMEQEFAAQIAAILIRLDLPVAKVVYKPHLRNTAVVNRVRQHHSAPN
jgi:hypothetical protein